MTKVATHPNPVRRPAPSFMLRAVLDDVGGGDNFEQVWTKRVGADRFELCCIPFFAYGMALGDVVRADAATGYVIQAVEQRSGNGVVRVAVKRPEEVDAVHLRLHDLIGRLEYLCEWFDPGYVAVSLEPGRFHDEFFRVRRVARRSAMKVRIRPVPRSRPQPKMPSGPQPPR